MSDGAARDLLRLYRVRDWAHFLPLPLAGWAAGDARSATSLAGGALAWALALAYMSALNQAFDDGHDRRPGKNPVGVSLDRRRAIACAAPAALGCLAATALWVPSRAALSAALLAASTVYSAPPRLKSVPLVGTLWNVVLAAPGLVLAGGPRAGHPSFAALAGVFCAALLGSQLLHEAEDRDDDRAGGASTVAVMLGARGALALTAALLTVVPALAWSLAAAMPRRGLFTLLVGAWCGPWAVALASRALRGDLVDLRALRLRYRHAAVALGAAAFAVSLAP